MAEPVDDTREMTVEDCAAISRGVSAVLDVGDPIKSKFTLGFVPRSVAPFVARLPFCRELAKSAPRC